MGSNHRVFVLACGGPEDRHGSHWRGDWGFWDAGPEFVTHYSGRVAANLATTDGQHMRCFFQLVHPSDGMAGGGRGKCQLPKGNTIDATFPKA